MTRYFDELDRRFVNGFDSDAALDDAPLSLGPPNGVFMIAHLGEVVVGCGGIQYVDAGTAEIKRMWVDPSRRGIGLGKRLLRHLEAEVQSSGRSRVVLDTNN